MNIEQTWLEAKRNRLSFFSFFGLMGINYEKRKGLFRGSLEQESKKAAQAWKEAGKKLILKPILLRTTLEILVNPPSFFFEVLNSVVQHVLLAPKGLLPKGKQSCTILI